MWVFPAFFSAAGVTGRGEATRTRLVDARREAVGVEERPFSRDFSKSLEERWSQKRGGAEGGAPSYTRRTAMSLALFFFSFCARLVCAGPPLGSFFSFAFFSFALVSVALLSRWFMHSLPVVQLSSCGSAIPVVQLSSCGSALLLWFSSPPVVQLSSCGSALLLWFSSSCGSAGPVVHALVVLWSDLFVGDAYWRRSSAGCGTRPSVSVRGAPERARRPSRHLEGAGNLPWSRGTRSVLQVPRYKGPRTLSTSLSVRGSFLCF